MVNTWTSPYGLPSGREIHLNKTDQQKEAIKQERVALDYNSIQKSVEAREKAIKEMREKIRGNGGAAPQS